MATLQHVCCALGDGDWFVPIDGMPSLGSPCETIPTRRNSHSQDPDALITARRDIARSPTPRDLDSPFQMRVSAVEDWSLSPWASKCIIIVTQRR